MSRCPRQAALGNPPLPDREQSAGKPARASSARIPPRALEPPKADSAQVPTELPQGGPQALREPPLVLAPALALAQTHKPFPLAIRQTSWAAALLASAARSISPASSSSRKPRTTASSSSSGTPPRTWELASAANRSARLSVHLPAHLSPGNLPPASLPQV